MRVQAIQHASIQQVLTYIQENLGEKHKVESLAQRANLSTFYFHRLVRLYLGESLGSYIKRLRMEAGLKLLRISDERVNDIAYRVGYETQSAFTKAFCQHYGISPKMARSEFKQKVIEKKDEMEDLGKNLINKQPEIIQLPDYFAAYTFVQGAYGCPETPKAWERVRSYACRNGYLRKDTLWHGICLDDPQVTANENTRYLACLSIPDDNPVVEEGIYFRKLKGGKFASFLHKGSYPDLQKSYDYIEMNWLIQPDFHIRDYHSVDIYLNTPKMTPPEELLTKIMIPLE